MDKRQLTELFATMEPKLDAAVKAVQDTPETVQARAKIQDLEAQGGAVARDIEKLRNTKDDGLSQAQADAQRLLTGASLDDLGDKPLLPSLERKRAAIEEAVKLAREEARSVERECIAERVQTLERTVNRYLKAEADAFAAAEKATQDVQALCAWLGAKGIRLDLRPAHWQLGAFEQNFLATAGEHLKRRRDTLKSS